MCSLLQNKKKSQHETTMGTTIRVKLKDKDYQKTKSTPHINGEYQYLSEFLHKYSEGGGAKPPK